MYNLEPCAAGHYGSSSGVCEMCPLNTYQNLIGQKECKSCADKTYTENKGSTAVSQCIGMLYFPDVYSIILKNNIEYCKFYSREKCNFVKNYKWLWIISLSFLFCGDFLCEFFPV
jgi:hypothetical protein